MFAGVRAHVWVLETFVSSQGDLLEISVPQGVCSGQLLSAKSGSSEAELLCARALTHPF